MTAMEDLTIAMEDLTAANRVVAMAADRAANLAPLGISCEFFVEYGLGWVFQWVWTVFRLSFPVSFD